MRIKDLRALILKGELKKFDNIYADTEAQKGRFLEAIDSFASLYGEDRDALILSVPGRSEICGNHTDHNFGCAIAGAIDRDIIAVVSKNDNGTVRLTSKGYYESSLKVSEIKNPDRFEKYASKSLIAGVLAGFERSGYNIGGFDAYTTSDVLKGSGLSSSAAFEVMVGNILNHLYNGGEVKSTELAKIAKFSENVYFGKPCGLMDQMASAVGGFVYIDFEDADNPVVESIDFSLKSQGYSLCILNTGGSHSDLNEEYALIPGEMKAVAQTLGADVLRRADKSRLLASIGELREKLGDRAVLRALHFYNENERVKELKGALEAEDMSRVLEVIQSSGISSISYLQNVYTPKSVREQGITLALALASGYLGDKTAAYRVHGGGFAGTAQIILPTEILKDFCEYMDGFFGKGAAMALNIRPLGACRLF